MTLSHKTCINTSGQGFKTIALIANVSFKTLPKSVNTSFMIKGHGQGVLKRTREITDIFNIFQGFSSGLLNEGPRDSL